MKKKLEKGRLIIDEPSLDLRPHEFKARDFLQNYEKFDLDFSVIRFFDYSPAEMIRIIDSFGQIDRSKFQNVKSLEFQGCGINDEILFQFLAKLPCFPNLRILNLRGNLIRFKGFNRLLKCLSQTSLEELDVSFNEIIFQPLKPSSFMQIVNLSKINFEGNLNFRAIQGILENSDNIVECRPTFDLMKQKRLKLETRVDGFLQFLRSNIFEFLTEESLGKFLGQVSLMINIMTNLQNPKISQDWQDFQKDPHLLGTMRDLAKKISGLHLLDERVCFVAIIDSFAEMTENIEKIDEKIDFAKNILAEEKNSFAFNFVINERSLDIDRHFFSNVNSLEKFHALTTEKIKKMSLLLINQKSLNSRYAYYEEFTERNKSWTERCEGDDFVTFNNWLKSSNNEEKKIFFNELEKANLLNALELIKEGEFELFEDLKTALIFKKQGHFTENVEKNISLSC